jgi:flagellar hook-length control protein FliK
MEIKGLGSNLIPLTQEKTVQSKELGFLQVLNKVINTKDADKPVQSDVEKKEPIDVKSLLAFLKMGDIKELSKENQVFDTNTANLGSDPLQMVKNILGISDKQWSEIIAAFEANTKEKLKDNDPISVLIAGLSMISMNPSLTGLTNNQILFLKAAKVYSLLSDQGTSGQQFLAGILDSLRDQLQTAVQNDQTQAKRTYLQNTFSQLVSDMKVDQEGANSANRQNAINRLTDWNAGSPFLQQMAKPEQLTIMAGTPKTVSVDDLIQQFESILSKSQFSKLGGVQKLFIKLNPEHLGSINIELIRKDQVLTARILTTTEAAKEALESHLHNLKHAFEAQSIKVDNVEIGQQSSQSQQGDFFNRGQSNSQDYQDDQDSETDDQEQTDSSFILTLEEAILNQEV